MVPARKREAPQFEGDCNDTVAVNSLISTLKTEFAMGSFNLRITQERMSVELGAFRLKAQAL